MCAANTSISTTEILSGLLSNSQLQARALRRIAQEGYDLPAPEMLGMIEAMAALLDRVLGEAHSLSEDLWLDLMKTTSEGVAEVHEIRAASA